MKTAVTGGSGIVGSAVVRHLVESGHEVRALARSGRSSQALVALGASVVRGDVLDTASVMRLVAGCDVVFHVAGVNEMCSKSPEAMWRVNVEGTRRVLTACRSKRVGRIVHTSSAVTVGDEEGVMATEATPHRGFYLSDYERSKAQAEHIALSEETGVKVVCVNPSSVQGPGRATGTGGLFLAAARGKLPVLFDTTVSVVDIEDCARGHLLAAERGEPGRRYLLSGATLEMREAIRLLSVAVGRRLSPFYLKPSAVSGLSSMVEFAFGVLGRRPPICREAARVMLHGHRYDGSRATRELGLEYTPIEETIRRTVEWFEDEALLITR